MEPRFKVGDRVRVKKRTALETHYPLWFTNSMTKYSCKVYTITEVDPDAYNPDHYRGYTDQPDPGDGARYRLDTPGMVTFAWSSPMLEKVDDAPVDIFKHYPGFIDPSFSHTLATEALKVEIDKKLLDCIAIPKLTKVNSVADVGKLDSGTLAIAPDKAGIHKLYVAQADGCVDVSASSEYGCSYSSDGTYEDTGVKTGVADSLGTTIESSPKHKPIKRVKCKKFNYAL